MKTLKSLWWLMLLTIIFKVYGLFTLVGDDAASSVYMKQNESLVGVTLLFVPLSAILAISWMFRRMYGSKRTGPGATVSEKSSLNFGAKQ